jgi:hypothetical protein
MGLIQSKAWKIDSIFHFHMIAQTSIFNFLNSKDILIRKQTSNTILKIRIDDLNLHFAMAMTIFSLG